MDPRKTYLTDAITIEPISISLCSGGRGGGREGGGNQSAHKEKAVKLFPAFDQFPRSKPPSQDFVVTFYLVGETLGPDGSHNGGCRDPDARPAFRRLLRGARSRALSQNLPLPLSYSHSLSHNRLYTFSTPISLFISPSFLIPSSSQFLLLLHLRETRWGFHGVGSSGRKFMQFIMMRH